MTKDSHVKLANLHGGRGEMGWVQPACSCGWVGKKHYAHNDYQYYNAIEEFINHRNTTEIELPCPTHP